MRDDAAFGGTYSHSVSPVVASTRIQRPEQAESVLWIRAEDLDPVSDLELAEHRRAVARTLNQLPPSYARALELKYGDGFSVDDIARVLGVTTIAAQSLLARARGAFKKSWAEQCVT